MRAMEKAGHSGVRVRSASGLVAAGQDHPTPQVEEAEAKASHISRTVRPVRQMIRCYDCGYEFPLTVRVKSTYCPKCRTTLDFIDYTIESEWTDTLKTEGAIRIAPLGVLKGGQLVATDVIIEGRSDQGTIRAFRCVELGAGAVFDEKKITTQDLKIAAGATITLQGPARYRDIEIAGTLVADLQAKGTITIRAGGLLRGTLTGSHLVVDEGGGIVGPVRIEEEKPLEAPAAAPPAPAPDKAPPPAADAPAPRAAPAAPPKAKGMPPRPKPAPAGNPAPAGKVARATRPSASPLPPRIIP